MLRDLIVSELHTQFPDLHFETGYPADPIVIIPTSNQEVGTVTISQYADEVTVDVGDIGHGHFDYDFDETLTPEQLTNRVVMGVSAFLRDLFANRIILHKSTRVVAGGWYLIGYKPDITLMDTDVRSYLWSGPTNILKQDDIS